MSYNTEYRGYSDGRLPDFGKKIREVNAAIVGTQECQDKDGLARASGYTLVNRDGGNNMFYNSSKVTLVHGSVGWMSILRDNYAARTIVWAKFRFNSTEFLFFNTHLPHRHNEASSRNSHAKIAQQLLRKYNELGAGPAILTGDMNPFASDGASMGSLEDNLERAGWHKAYQARGNPGYVGLDKIFCTGHWRFFNGKDRGTGRSDHPAISVDLTLKAD